MNRTMSRLFAGLCSTPFRGVSVGLAIVALLIAASGARASCSFTSKPGDPTPIPFVSPHQNESWNHDDGDDSNKHAGIVGLWHLFYTATSATPSGAFPPTPFPFAETFKTWHADGTEFENALLPPTGGNICFGVWKDLGDGHVKLHHIGAMFDSMGRVSNLFTIDEKNKVASNGKTYSGTFDFKLWPPNFDAVGVGTPLAEVTGTTAATRISVD